MIRSYTICPLAKPEATKIAVSTSGLGSNSLAAGIELVNVLNPPPGFEMVDVQLLREEAELLLSDSGDLRASTMVVHPYAVSLDSLTAMSTGYEVALYDEAGGLSILEPPPLMGGASEDELGAAAALSYARNRWLEKIMPSAEVQPIAFYPFFLSPNGLEYQTMPWFSVQLIRRSELAAARGEWCRMLGMTQDEYDASGEPHKRIAHRRHLVNLAAPKLTELFLEVRQGEVPCEESADAPAWRRAAKRCAEREALRWGGVAPKEQS